MGFSPVALYSMSLQEFKNAAEGYRDKIEQAERQNWQRQRWATCVLLGPHLKKGTNLTPEKLLPFEWEKGKASGSKPTKKEARESLERIKKRDRKKWQS